MPDITKEIGDKKEKVGTKLLAENQVLRLLQQWKTSELIQNT